MVQERAPRRAELGLAPASTGQHATRIHTGTTDVLRNKPVRLVQTGVPKPWHRSHGCQPREVLQV